MIQFHWTALRRNESHFNPPIPPHCDEYQMIQIISEIIYFCKKTLLLGLRTVTCITIPARKIRAKKFNNISFISTFVLAENHSAKGFHHDDLVKKPYAQNAHFEQDIIRQVSINQH